MDAFYSNIGKAVDTAIGYTYPAFQKRIDQVRSLGEKLNIVINIIERFNIGLIIFDEILMFLTSNNSNHEKVIGASDYDRTRLAEIEEASKLMKKDISKQSDIEHERTISKIKNKPSDKDMLIKSAVAKITAVSDDFKVNSIINVSKELYETGNYSVADEKQFTRDVMKVLSGKKIRSKKKPDRMSKDVMMQFLDNNTQDTN